MSRLLCFIGGWMLFASACGTPDASSQSSSTLETGTDRVVESHENGSPKLVYRYAGSDSLNRTELGYHPNGALLSEGQVVSGKRDGEWRSYHTNGTLWSLHHYINGQQNGEYRVLYPNGNPRIKGEYLNGEKSGQWVFFTEEGDTARVVSFDAPS